MKGVYSIAEVIDDSNKNPEKTIFCIVGDFTYGENLSLTAVGEMVELNGGIWIKDFNEIANYLNSFSDN